MVCPRMVEGGGGAGEVGEDPREQVARWCWPAFFISVCSIEAGDTEKKTSEKICLKSRM